ncbi:uncharacterized protein LOC123555826 [Mercenaria mercenaria]|uniref:uncharacterized protein LOC123555826 n=1 Tax=Mercenaria mercenaria TaxID=6596 RepID=UPI00234E88C1|nr:uncharacterized protein LOC123555826 [Mercenaria mercenaria]
MLFTMGLVMLIATCRILAVSDSLITIGIIANGTENVETVNILSHSHAFKIVKHIINTTEVYNIFSSVQRLDASASVDVITLLNYDISIVKMPQILRTHNKKLIKMGARPRFHQNIDGTKTEISKNTVSCTMDLDDFRNDVYCVPTTNGTTVDR